MSDEMQCNHIECEIRGCDCGCHVPDFTPRCQIAAHQGSLADDPQARALLKQCWLWGGATNPSGYGTTTYGGKTMGAHRVAWIVHNGPIPDGKFICHHCDVKRCINPSHLYAGTHRDNMDDAVERNRMASGIDQGSATLTDDEVAEIRSLAAKGIPQRQLSHDFEVSQSTINRLVNEVHRASGEARELPTQCEHGILRYRREGNPDYRCRRRAIGDLCWQHKGLADVAAGGDNE